MAVIWTGLVLIAYLIAHQQEVLANFLIPRCGRTYFPPATSRIYNGQSAIIGSAPFMAYLYDNSGLYCGGTIIAARYILTAAHCLRKGLKVRLGEYDTRTNPDCQRDSCIPSSEDYGIERAIRHQDYNDTTLANDIALLKLNRSINFNVHIQPVCLIRDPAYLPRINEFKAFGWGKTANGSISAVLQTAKLYLYKKSYCNRKMSETLTQNQICAGTRTSDTCQGDSGGPLVTLVNNHGVIRYLQLGIVSFGDQWCSGIGVYTYVPNYIHWIWERIKDHIQ